MAAGPRHVSIWSSRIFTAALFLLFAIGLAGLGVLLSNTFGASQVAGNARQLHLTNAALGSAGIARAAVAQAVFFSVVDPVDSDARTQAVTEAQTNLDAVASLATHSDLRDEPDLHAAIEGFVATGRSVVRLAEAGSGSDAEVARATDFEPTFEELSAALREKQNRLAETIDDSERTGGRIARITFVAIAFFIPAVAMVIFWLVTRRRLREREAAMQARLEAEQQLGRAKDDLIAGLSHELRTPLTTIFGFAELLAQDTAIPSEARDLAGMISSSSSELTRMVNDLLVLARLHDDSLSMRAERFELADVIDNVVAPYLRSGTDIEVRLPSIEVHADRVHLRQIIHNLVSNGAKHGSSMVITARSDGRRATLVVADNGPGIPEDRLDSLFTPFSNVGRDALLAGSLGFGLAVSSELTRRMGGTLRYQRIGTWTSFVLSLPAFSSEMAVAEPVGAPG